MNHSSPSTNSNCSSQNKISSTKNIPTTTTINNSQLNLEQQQHQQQYYIRPMSNQQASKPNSISSFQTNPSSPRDLIGIKLSKVKATAALFESLQSPTGDSHSILIRTCSLDHPQRLSSNHHHHPNHPSPNSDPSPSLRLSTGHVNQIKNQFLSNPSLVDLQRRHSSDRPHPSTRVLKNYDPDHLNRLSQSIIPNQSSSSTSSSLGVTATATTTTTTTATPSTTADTAPATSQNTARAQSHSPSSLHHHFHKLTLPPNQQPLGPPSPSTDHHPTSDSNSTSTSQHEPSSTRALSIEDHPITSPSHHHHPTSHNLFSEQEPNPLDTHSHQSKPSQDTLNDITTLALSARITEVAMSIQEVALALFQVQELRHSQSESKRNSSVQTSPSILAADRPSGSALTQVDKALMRLEKKVESTTVEIAQLETLIRPYRNQDPTPSASPPSAQSKLINDKFDNITEEWQRIQHDTEVLQDELKEDKWLVVFRAVSGQAEEMMESLEKVLAVSQEFIRETHRRTRRSSPPVQNNGSPLRRKNRESHASSISSGDRLESEELMKSYNALIKNFHAKHKHYVPSCERVLGILSKGIKSRSTKNGEVLRRYADMNLRFTTIQENINRVGLDLLAVEKILQQACVAASDTTPADRSVQAASEHSFLQLPTDLHPPKTPTSPGPSSKTRKALTTMSNYLISTSPQFLSKHSSGISNSISPFRKLANKFTSATPSVPSQSSSVCSGLTPSGSTPAFAGNGSSTTTTNRPSQQRSLRPIRSTLNFGPSSSSSSISRMMSKTSTPSHPGAAEERRAPNTVPEPSCPRPGSRQIHHQHTPSYDKPRWNISLKRIEDTPGSTASGTSLTKSSSRRTTGGIAGSRSQSRAALRSSAPYGGGIYERPGSVAGRSEASCGTTLSMSVYRSRPPSRHSRIPAPLWDPGMESQRVQSKGSIDLADLVRPYSRTALTSRTVRPATALSTLSTGLLSPTESDMAKMPPRPPTTLALSRRPSDPHRHSLSSTSAAPPPNRHRQTMVSIEAVDPNPADPLDVLIHSKCLKLSSKIIPRRLDSPLSRNPEKARLAGAGIGDQARYAFWCIGIGKASEEKSVMCKLVESKRSTTTTTTTLTHPSSSSNINNPNTTHTSTATPFKSNSTANPLLSIISSTLTNLDLKVLVRTKNGWKDLDGYLHDCLHSSS